MINSSITELSRATQANIGGRLAAALIALGALACSGGGERADASAADSAALAPSTTASTATGTVAATNVDSAAAATTSPATPAAQPATGATGVNKDSTPSRVTRDGAEQLKTRATTPPSEAKRLDSATRTAARQGATTRDTARAGRVTPPPPVRKTATPAATSERATSGAATSTTPPAAATPSATTPSATTAAQPASTGAAGGSAGGATGGAATPAQQTSQQPSQQTAQGANDHLTAAPAAYQGWKTFHVYCYRCHGTDAMGSDLAPNLRHSVGPQGSVTQEGFMTTVKEGRLAKGMPAWKEMLTDEQIRNLYAYVKARSTGELAAGRPRQAKQ